MSKLAEFKALEAQLAAQLQQLDALKNDAALKQEIEFETQLRALLAEYGMSLQHIIAILDPSRLTGAVALRPKAPIPRRPRELKRYRHPESGEIVETKGGNHTRLKQWKQEHGADVVEGWRQ